MGKEAGALAGFAMLVLGAALAMAVACLVLIKFSKHFITGKTLWDIIKQCLLYSLAFTLAIGFASFLHMLFLHSRAYSDLMPQMHTTAVAGAVLQALIWPAFYFFIDLAVSFLWASQIGRVLQSRRLLRAVLTPLGLSLIFAMSSFAYLATTSYLVGSFFPGDFVGYYIDTLWFGAETMALLLSSPQTGWQVLWNMFDVRGNFFALTQVFSMLFVVVAIATGLANLSTVLAPATDRAS